MPVPHGLNGAAPIAPRILDEAAGWLTRLASGDASEQDRRACEQWRQTSPEHARAWARAEILLDKLGGLPSTLAMPALDRPDQAGRRMALGKLSAWLAALPAGWLAWRLADTEGWTADHHTAIGERRGLSLSDGTRLNLDTATAIDVRFDGTQRLLRLLRGRLLIQTGHETLALSRPFRVLTPQGRMQALGTRFIVDGTEAATRVAVLEGAVRLEPLHGPPLVLRAGEQAAFTAKGVGPVSATSPGVGAWTHGMLLADKTPLPELAAELARYRHGRLRCDPALAGLRVSGAFPVGDAPATDRALAMLVSTYPIEAEARWQGWWVTLRPRP